MYENLLQREKELFAVPSTTDAEEQEEGKKTQVQHEEEHSHGKKGEQI